MSLLVNRRQRGNEVLSYIRHVPWEYEDIESDFMCGACESCCRGWQRYRSSWRTQWSAVSGKQYRVFLNVVSYRVAGRGTAVLFLSLRFHLLNPKYILPRLRELRGLRDVSLRVLLVLADIDDAVQPLQEIARDACLMDCTLVLAWTAQEAARYLETYKAFEKKAATTIQEKPSATYGEAMASVFTQVRSINKTDVLTLSSHFASVEAIARASPDTLATLPGLGDKKASRLHEAFHKPFTSTGADPQKRRRLGLPAAPSRSSAQRKQAETSESDTEAATSTTANEEELPT